MIKGTLGQSDPVEFGILFVGVLVLAAVRFADWLQWRNRLMDLRGDHLYATPTTKIIWDAGWLLFIVLALSPDMHPGLLLLSVAASFALLTILTYLREAKQRRAAATCEVSRGFLRSSVEDLVSKAGVRSINEWIFCVTLVDLYVIPDGFQEWTVTGRGRNVVIAQRYLERMSRSEIDSLVARQLARQQWQYYLPPVAAAFCGGLVAVGLLELFEAGQHERWLVLLLLLVIEMSTLAIYSPWAFRRADLRAVRLTGNPESFISALAQLARLSGRKLDTLLVRRLVRKTGIETGRLFDLTTAKDHPPADRYPTSGDYFATGL